MPRLVVVDTPSDWPSAEGGTEVTGSLDYISDPRFAKTSGTTKIVNLCGDYHYQSVGYYVSLLAAARGHRVTPSASAIREVDLDAKVRQVAERLSTDIRRALKGTEGDELHRRIEFGVTDDPRLAAIARRLFGAFHLPIMDVRFDRVDGTWWLGDVTAIAPAELDDEARAQLLRHAEDHLTSGRLRTRTKSYRYDLAILWNPDATDAPSNRAALGRFEQAAEQLGVRAARITAADYGRLPEFDALFIRETTSVEDHTYRFAQRAALEDLVVVDDPESILRCSNKVFLAELLTRHRLPHPRTWVLARQRFDEVAPQLPLPVVLKPPDGCFSQGMAKVRDRAQLEGAAERLFERSDLILAQEFVPTEYDWRIGVLDGAPLYACRYFMAKDHWQIIHRDGRGREREGNHETIDVNKAPSFVVQTALRACRPIGRGLYGVDLKERGGRAYVIEVNDNPNLDVGVEDQFLGSRLYAQIMEWFVQQIEAKKTSRRP